MLSSSIKLFLKNIPNIKINIIKINSQYAPASLVIEYVCLEKWFKNKNMFLPNNTEIDKAIMYMKKIVLVGLIFTSQ